jgi:hypothetical protein
MPLNHYTFSVGSTTPTCLTPEGREVGGSLTVHIQNTGSHKIVIGGEGLTVATSGRHLNAGDSVSFENLTTVDEIYALAESNASNVSVIIIKR